ncbi:N-acetyl-alpha-D-glucosaminyl L-malate synthase BshA [Pueribacillus theae]|uniref:N-acetyl-alpha-D-glucosaminyl L-malate synthase BshA n=1 Tax=Pueribacillus theae TaxID=2171751 RepID=A0A2U1K493_9BACI|nr:N-acetyl-alpha-D-glucosaminyl L-malate synthase BshA [Pueribacillus theae]PWA12347.1 N-acetyl-alpha-D-glucosaminyl L-malate synthase BshA [Pueribacillus theae]
MQLKIGIACYPTIGGSGIVASELGKLLAKKGHCIHFFSSSVPFRLGRVYPNIFFHEVEVNQYAVFRYPPYDLTLASKMADIINREQLDVLHVHYAVPHAICAYLAKQISGKDVKIVTTLHGTDITVLGYDPSLSNVIRFGIENSDRVTAVSHDLKRQTQELLKTDFPIETVHNFVDEKTYYKRTDSRLKCDYHIKQNEKTVVHISNFRKVKRVTDVIYIFKEIAERIQAKLLLVGDGPDLSTVSHLVDELGLRNNVLFLGKQENVAEILSISDLLLLPSEKESFGLVLLEAMACKVPVIATAVGGIPEVVVHNETGFLSQIGDIESMARYAIRLLTDEALHKTFSENAYSRVHSHFHSEIIVNEYEKIYHDILNK